MNGKYRLATFTFCSIGAIKSGKGYKNFAYLFIPSRNDSNVATTTLSGPSFTQTKDSGYNAEPMKRDISLVTPYSAGVFLNTHQMVKALKSQGFTTAQSETLTDILTNVVLVNAETQFKHSVSKEQLEISTQQLLAQTDGIKKDMLILEKSQFAHLRHDLDKLSLQIKQLDSKLFDECTKLKSGFALDINLEKSRAKEDLHKLETDIQSLTNRIGLEVANMRADIANLRANFEGSRTDIIKYVARTATGTIISVCTIGFLIYRFLS